MVGLILGEFVIVVDSGLAVAQGLHRTEHALASHLLLLFARDLPVLARQ